MKHRRILSILLAAATAVSVAGCSKNETSGSESSAPDDSSSPAGVQTASNVSDTYILSYTLCPSPPSTLCK